MYKKIMTPLWQPLDLLEMLSGILLVSAPWFKWKTNQSKWKSNQCATNQVSKLHIHNMSCLFIQDKGIPNRQGKKKGSQNWVLKLDRVSILLIECVFSQVLFNFLYALWKLFFNMQKCISIYQMIFVVAFIIWGNILPGSEKILSMAYLLVGALMQ